MSTKEYLQAKLKSKQQSEKTIYNPLNPIFKKLTRFMSGPIVKYKVPDVISPQGRFGNKQNINPENIPLKRNDAYLNFNQMTNDKALQVLRAERYMDFESMEFTPEINTALDIYAGDIASYTEFSEILKIVTPNDEIKEVLRTLFYDVINIEMNLFGWVRSCCKYGDFFLFLDLDDKLGISRVVALPVLEIERLENEDPSNPNYVKFQWNKEGVTFENFSIAHFRILGDDKFYPYGTCLKYDTRVWTQNGIEEIRNIKKNDWVLTFDNQSQKYISTKVLDTVHSGQKQCYKLSTRHNFIEASKEHKILVVRNNEWKYLNTLEIQVGDKLVIKSNHSFDHKIKIDKTCPSENKNGWWNKSSCIPEFVNNEFAELFGFLIGDGWICGNDVCFAEGVYPSINQKYIDLIKLFSNGNVRHIKSENATGQYMCSSKLLKTILKRMDFNGKATTKRLPKWIFEASREIQESFLNGLYNSDGSSFVDEWNCERFTFEMNNEQLIKDIKSLVQILGYKSGKINSRIRKEVKLQNGRIIKPTQKSYYFNYFKSKLKQSKKQDVSVRLSNEYVVEPIISIEQTDICDVYDIYVENKNHNFVANGIVVHNSILEGARRVFRQLNLLEDNMMAYRIVRAPERRIFFLDTSGIEPDKKEAAIEKTITSLKREPIVDPTTGRINLKYGAASVENDIFIPITKGSETRVETVPGGQNLAAVDDVKLIRDKLFSALKIPASYLSSEGSAEDRTSLAQKDIVFARTVLRIQNSIIAELTKIAMIHLITLGYSGKDILNFKLKLNNPSRIAEMQELEQLKSRTAVAGSLSESYFSKEYIWKKIYSLNDEEIQRMKIEILGDSKFNAYLASIESNSMNGGGDMTGGGGGGAGLDLGLGDIDPMAGQEGLGPQDNNLLVTPENDMGNVQMEGPPPGEQGRRMDDAYLTPGAKGKAYHPIRPGADGRLSSGRAKQMKAMGGSTHAMFRDLFPGFKSMDSLSRGIFPESIQNDPDETALEQAEEQIEETENLLKEKRELINSRFSMYLKKK